MRRARSMEGKLSAPVGASTDSAASGQVEGSSAEDAAEFNKALSDFAMEIAQNSMDDMQEAISESEQDEQG